jgi:hypothetical protein
MRGPLQTSKVRQGAAVAAAVLAGLLGAGTASSGTFEFTGVGPTASPNTPPAWEDTLAPLTVQAGSTVIVDLIGRDVDGDDLIFFTGTNGCANPAIAGGPEFQDDTGLSPFEGNVLEAGVPRREWVALTIHTKPGAAAGTYCLRLFAGEADGERSVGLGTVDIVIVDSSPAAATDAYATDEDVTLTKAAPGVLANDADPNGDPLTAELVTGPAHGSLTLAPNGSFEYTPALNFNGSDEFTYRAIDSHGNASVPVKASLTVNPVSDRPEWESTPSLITIRPDSTVTVDVIGRDVDGSDLEFFINFTIAGACVVPAVPGGPAFQDDTGLSPFEGVVLDSGAPRRESATLTIHTKPNVAAGAYCLRLMVADADSGVARIVLITIEDSSPVAVSDSYVTDEGVTLARPAPGVLANDADANGDPLTAELVTGPAHGALTLAPNGSFEYVPAPNFHGVDEFAYRALDPKGNASAPVTVSLTVQPAVDGTPPTCVIVEHGKTAAGNAFITFQVNDVGLGLASHKVTYVRNATVQVDAYLPGSLGPVLVKATAVDKRLSLGVQVDFLDRAGNLASCDPIVLSVVREANRLQDETFSNVPQAESLVSIYNGSPGMKRVVIIVNGKKFKQRDLKANEVRKFDVSSAMKPGATNTITVRVRGKKGASALIVIADIP